MNRDKRTTKQRGGYEGEELVQGLTTEIKSYLSPANGGAITSSQLFKNVDKLLVTITKTMLKFIPQNELKQNFPSIIKLILNSNIDSQQKYNILTLVIDTVVNEVLKKQGININETVVEKTDRLSRQFYHSLYIEQYYWTINPQLALESINNETDRINAIYVKKLAQQKVDVLKHPNRINKLLQDTMKIDAKQKLVKNAIDKAKDQLIADLSEAIEISNRTGVILERVSTVTQERQENNWAYMDDANTAIDYELLEPNKPIKTIRNISVYDAINMEDVKLSDYLEEDPNNIVLEFNGNVFIVNKNHIKKQIPVAKYYACFENSGVMARRIDGNIVHNIDKKTILYDIKKASGLMLDGYLSFASILNLLNNNIRAFSIAKTTKSVASSISYLIENEGDSWVSGHHCTTGSANVYTLVPAELNLAATGGSRKTKQNKYSGVKPLTQKQKQLLAKYYNIYV